MITLLTDFGTADYFVGAVKGVIRSLQPTAPIVDITHDIPAHDVRAGAFTLGACWRAFPAGTIHLAIVDPGVGSTRRPLVAHIGEHFFVGPDNGLLSVVCAQAERAGWPMRGIHATRAEFFRATSSEQAAATFHGRDVFAPLAGWLARGVTVESFGAAISDYERFALPQPQCATLEHNEQVMRGEIIHIDRFGNCITNLTPADWPLAQAFADAPACDFRVGDVRVTQFGTHYAEATQRDQLFAYPGSAGFWEVALWCASAAAHYDITRGISVTLRSVTGE